MGVSKQSGYSAVLPMQLVRDENLTASAIRVYAMVYGFCNYYGQCTVSNRYLAEELHTSERNIQRLIGQLVEHGYLESKVDENTNTKNGMSSRTIWLAHAEFIPTPHDKIVTPPHDKIVTQIINNNNNTPYSPPKGDGAQRRRMRKDEQGRVLLNEIEESLFAIFWRSYPNKAGKEPARKAFWKLNPDEALMKTILIALDKLKNTEQWRDRAVIPHASTWLNNRRWEDAEGLPDPEPEKQKKENWI